MNNKDVFAWSHVDMLGIDPSVACHRLNVDPNHPTHQQRQMMFALERNQVISDEVDRFLEVGFIRDVWCKSWISNVVVMAKKKEENGEFVSITSI
ncbi:unnamed protein product [Prunus armeniaca]